MTTTTMPPHAATTEVASSYFNLSSFGELAGRAVSIITDFSSSIADFARNFFANPREFAAENPARVAAAVILPATVLYLSAAFIFKFFPFAANATGSDTGSTDAAPTVVVPDATVVTPVVVPDATVVTPAPAPAPAAFAAATPAARTEVEAESDHEVEAESDHEAPSGDAS